MKTTPKKTRKAQQGNQPQTAQKRELKSMVCIKMQPSLKAAAQAHAQAHGMAFGELVRYALQLYLDMYAARQQQNTP